MALHFRILPFNHMAEVAHNIERVLGSDATRKQ